MSKVMAQAIATEICSQDLPSPLLAVKKQDEVCQDFLKGLCGDQKCRKDHRIYKIAQEPKAKLAVLKNRLVLQASHPKDSYDNDAPGLRSSGGPRHDNDYVEIKDIQILPTSDEILSLRPTYLPLKEQGTPHRLSKGGQRHFDTLFRHLREDSIASLKDVCYHSAQQLVEQSFPRSAVKPHQETSNGATYNLFWDVKYEELLHHHVKGILVRVSFACPDFLQGRKLHQAKHFEKGMMVALIGLDDEDEEKSLSVTFMEVHLSESTEGMKAETGLTDRAAIQLSFAQPNSETDVRRIVYYSQKVLSGRFILVEFPSVLLAGFDWCLQNLQRLEEKDVAFIETIAPKGETAPIKVPEYANEPGFQFNLRSVFTRQTPDTQMLYTMESICANKDGFKTALKKSSTLDEGQADAFTHVLTSDFAFTQGPPGTGKTFLGVNLTKTLLASTSPKSSKPILVVCLTNHALDSFLQDLISDGVDKIVRLGGGSKDPAMGKYNLQALRGTMRSAQPMREAYAKKQARKGVEYFVRQLKDRTSGLKGNPSALGWYYVQDHLQQNYPSIYSQLELVASGNPNDREAEMMASGFAYEFWSQGGDILALEAVHKEFAKYLGIETDPLNGTPLYVLAEKIAERYIRTKLEQGATIGTSNIWKLPLVKREFMIEKWIKEIDNMRAYDELAEIHCRHQKAVQQKKLTEEDEDTRCLASQKVIGMTTTACARNWGMLKKLGVRICISEEAGEIIEPHALCTLLPSVQHAISIGDPLQLRAKVNQKLFSKEESNLYQLDVSLMERFMSESGSQPISTSRLTVQRRMHPQIADLCRATLYPYLKDAPNTLKHPPVADLVSRCYWFDHKVPEDVLDPNSDHPTSFSNSYEVDMVVGLVKHLITTNAYELGDISVISPYNGQIAELARKLGTTCSIFLNEKDRLALVDDGHLSEEHEFSNDRADVRLQDMLRLTSWDNFQGEQSKVVIVPTVRSNTHSRVGFLKTENRINVAISRAQHGFYIIGNSECLSTVPMWKKIIDQFASNGDLGPVFKTHCSRHPQHQFEVRQPKDFAHIPKCEVVCGYTLDCGHQCKELCHPAAIHDIMECSEISTTTVKCGHEVKVTCKQSNMGVIPRCKAVSSVLERPCGHNFEVQCEQVKEFIACNDRCNNVLPCGHQCSDKCEKCQKSEKHSSCTAICEKELSCGHFCDTQCHDGVCSPCTQPCKRGCPHGKCLKGCGVTCEPCVKPCKLPGCEHGDHDDKTFIMCFLCPNATTASDLSETEVESSKIKDAVDHMIFHLARKLNSQSKKIEYERLQLRDTSASFLSSIRPNPMATKENTRKTRERLGTLVEVEHNITKINDDLVTVFENNLCALRKTNTADDLPEYRFAFGLRFDLLQHKAHFIALEEAWTISQHLAKMKGDPSFQILVLAEGLQQKAIQEGKKHIAMLEAEIAECVPKELPCLEVEMHLMLLQFVSLVERAKKTYGTEAFTASFNRVPLLCNSYPDTAGKFFSAFSTMRNALIRGAVPQNPDGTAARNTAAAWVGHKIGHLTVCPNNHPFSTKSFSSCPECGRMVKKALGKDETKYEQHIFNDAFLKAMHSRSSSPMRSYGYVPATRPKSVSPKRTSS